MNSRSKGCRGELEARDFIRSYGYEAERGQQRAGSEESPDVKHNIPNIHVEVKRVEAKAAGSIYDWLEQAIRDAGKRTPIVLHRRNRKQWVVIMRATDFMNMLPGEY